MYASKDIMKNVFSCLSFARYWNRELVNHKSGGSTRLWLAISTCVWWRIGLQGILLGLLVRFEDFF